MPFLSFKAMEFIRIESVNDKFIEELLLLYKEAFPENQRRSELGFKKTISESNRMNFHCNAVLLNKLFVGFFNYWKFDSFIFAEHFAVEQALRGNKIGEKVMKMIKSTAQLPLVFEVELPDNEINSRRIEFYRRLGYEIVPVNYLQPPYNTGGEFVSLHLMTDELDFVMDNYDSVKETIYKNVYGIRL